MFKEFQAKYYADPGVNLPSLPDCQTFSYDLINSNMLLQDIYAPQKFLSKEILTQTLEEEKQDYAADSTPDGGELARLAAFRKRLTD